MSLGRTFTFACLIAGQQTRGHIVSPGGHVVMIEPAEMPNLLLDLAADTQGNIGCADYHNLVLEEWFSRKTAPARPCHLRLVG